MAPLWFGYRPIAPANFIGDKVIKVISLNTWGGKLLQDILGFLQSEDPDILFLQEVYSSDEDAYEPRYRSLQQLEAQLSDYSYQYAPAFTAGWLDGKVTAGNATFSKFKLSNNAIKFFDIPFVENWQGANPPGDFSKVPRNMQHTVAKHPELGEIHLINVHGISDSHGRDTDRRLKMAQTILDDASHLSNVIIAGDFNMDSDTKAIRTITEKFTPVFPELETSFNMRRKKDEAFAKLAVDKMFVGRGFEVINADCPDLDLSDHRPLIVELRF